jgi:hypothetical protein
MGRRKRYRKRTDQFIVAVQLKLDTDGFAYRKWGADQYCKPGDWLVDNGGDIYTIDQQVFVDTYEQIDPGRYRKRTPIWAEVATESGVVETKEGQSHYRTGDYLVFNNADGTDSYCISADKFEAMYELDE